MILSITKQAFFCDAGDESVIGMRLENLKKIDKITKIIIFYTRTGSGIRILLPNVTSSVRKKNCLFLLLNQYIYPFIIRTLFYRRKFSLFTKTLSRLESISPFTFQNESKAA